MKTWIKKLAAPVWAALYLIIFRGFGAVMFVSISISWGVWAATLILICLYGLWGTLFYLVLIQTISFEQVKETLNKLLEKRKNRLFIWIREKFFEKEIVTVSPMLIIFIFIAGSPLSGVPVIRLAYPKEKFWKGLVLVWLGSIAEVATWFLPVYGGGISLIKAFLVWLGVAL